MACVFKQGPEEKDFTLLDFSEYQMKKVYTLKLLMSHYFMREVGLSWKGNGPSREFERLMNNMPSRKAVLSDIIFLLVESGGEWG